ncbi:diaminopimelate decarboxylase [Planctomycetota bacterium]|nr:diaminopimelate decarboxylase [Planctomycetota bacterium]
MHALPLRHPCAGAGTDHVHYLDGVLCCEGQSLDQLATRFGTPLYVYSWATIRERFALLRRAFGPSAEICYAVKANGNRTLLQRLAALGADFDLVSGGELLRLLAAGIDAQRAVFAGVAKERWEIEAAVRSSVRAFHVESPHELSLLAAAGRASGVRVPVSLRLNPGIAVDTHAYTATACADSKFGVAMAKAGAVVEQIAADSALELCGYHVHLGSQLRNFEPYVRAFDVVEAFLDGAEVRRRGIRHYDLGGGFGIAYGKGDALDVTAVAAALLPRLAARGLTPVLEPGRFLVGDAGVLVSTVIGSKQAGGTNFLLADAAMNDLVRPALYGAEHPIAPVRSPDRATQEVDVVGPVCESGDFLGRRRALPSLAAGERIAVLGAGAYGFSMASNYNTRRLPAEVLVDGAAVTLIRRRQEWSQLWADEVDPK